jgi:hypothetical protein
MNTPEQQARVIVEILRTRCIGGGSASVLSLEEMGAPGRSAPPRALPAQTIEEYSRDQVERAIERVGDMRPQAQRALNEVFNADVGGYRDIEWYAAHYPEIAREATFGVWLLLTQLPAAKYMLDVRMPEERTPEENVAQFMRDHRIYKGYLSGVPVQIIAQDYNTSERTIYRIIRRQRELEGEPARLPGRPRKEENG